MSTAADYQRIFDEARAIEYPEIDRFEEARGVRVNREELNAAARVLACPLKVNAPHWQHGRVIYAAALARAAHPAEGLFLDIGTAKGFSACVMTWVIATAGRDRKVVSVDVMSPIDPIRRNSVAELDGLKTLDQFVDPFINRQVTTEFHGCGIAAWFYKPPHDRIAFAFVDGKHTYQGVRFEALEIAARQQTGDVIVFDDLQIEPVHRAVRELSGYHLEEITAGPRRYAVAWRI